jgi:hypothetical protein
MQRSELHCHSSVRRVLLGVLALIAAPSSVLAQQPSALHADIVVTGARVWTRPAETIALVSANANNRLSRE